MIPKINTSFIYPLKFIAALGIIFYHLLSNIFISLGYSTDSLLLVQFYTDCRYIVELFFIISGFLTMKSYIEKKKGVDIKNKFLNFYVLFIITIVANYLLRLVMGKNTGTIKQTSFLDFILNLFMVNENILSMPGINSLNSAMWYMVVLFLDYTLFNLFKNNKHSFKAIIGIAGLLLLLRVEIPFINFHTCRGIMAFMVGCELYKYVINISPTPSSSLKRNLINFLRIIILSFLFILAIKCYSQVYDVLIHIVMFSVLIITLCQNNFVESISNNAFCKYLGKLSYHIYLWGVFVYEGLYLFVQKGLNISNISLTVIICYMINILIAIISQSITERIHIGKK